MTFHQGLIGLANPLLSWAPPAQTGPSTHEVPAGGGEWWGVELGSTEDAIIKLPATKARHQLEVIGGRHVRIIGGYLEAVSAASSAIIRVKHTSGSIFLEGLRIDGAGYENDALDLNGSDTEPYTYKPDVYIQNCHITGIHGHYTGLHADILQPQGAIGNLHIDKLTAYSQYEGLFLDQQHAIASADIRRANFGYIPGGDTYTYLLWFPYGSETYYPVTLDRVYTDVKAGQTLIDDAIWPKAGQKNGAAELIGAETSDGGLTATFPAASYITGTVTKGPPPGGDIVTTSDCGLGYVSPGYQ